MGKHGTQNYAILPTRYSSTFHLRKWINPWEEREKKQHSLQNFENIPHRRTCHMSHSVKTRLISSSPASFLFMCFRNQRSVGAQITLFCLIFQIEITAMKSFCFQIDILHKSWRLCFSVCFYDCMPFFLFCSLTTISHLSFPYLQTHTHMLSVICGLRI